MHQVLANDHKTDTSQGTGLTQRDSIYALCYKIWRRYIQNTYLNTFGTLKKN